MAVACLSRREHRSMHKAAARQDHARATEDDDEAGLTRAASEPCQAICIHARENRPVIRSGHTAARAPKAWQPAAGLESRSRERAGERVLAPPHADASRGSSHLAAAGSNGGSEARWPWARSREPCSIRASMGSGRRRQSPALTRRVAVYRPRA